LSPAAHPTREEGLNAHEKTPDHGEGDAGAELKERRALKQEKKDARKAEAAERAAGIANGTYVEPELDEQAGEGEPVAGEGEPAAG
jgi:hypothetical protein